MYAFTWEELIMANILYYISGHGFGHLTRSLSLIESMVTLRKDIQVTIKCHSHHADFAQRYLAEKKISAEVVAFDSTFNMVVDWDNLTIDKEATGENVREWVNGLKSQVEREMTAVGSTYIAVISDIVPEAFAIAERLGIPSLAISNFTWYEVCRGFVDDVKDVEQLLAFYQKTTQMLEYPISTGDAMPITNRLPVGLLTRPVDDGKVQAIRGKYKKANRPLVFVSVGGAVKLDELRLPDDADYLYTRGLSLPPGPNMFAISPDEPDTQNYVSACDAVITKFGWSTLAEAIIARKPVFMLSVGGGWAEEDLTWQELSGFGIIERVHPRDLYDVVVGRWQEKIAHLSRYDDIPARYCGNKAEEIARLALEILGI